MTGGKSVWRLRAELSFGRGRAQDHPGIVPPMTDERESGTANQELEEILASKEKAWATEHRNRETSDDACYRLIREVLNPVFDETVERVNQTTMPRQVEAAGVPEEHAVFLAIKDIDQDRVIGPQLVCSCQAERGKITLTLGAADYNALNLDVPNTAATRAFRAAEGNRSYNYSAFTREVVQKKVNLFLKHFL